MADGKTTHILGQQYDLDSNEDQRRLMDRIDEYKAKGHAGDLSAICYALLIAYIERGIA